MFHKYGGSLADVRSAQYISFDHHILFIRSFEHFTLQTFVVPQLTGKQQVSRIDALVRAELEFVPVLLSQLINTDPTALEMIITGGTIVNSTEIVVEMATAAIDAAPIPLLR